MLIHIPGAIGGSLQVGATSYTLVNGIVSVTVAGDIAKIEAAYPDYAIVTANPNETWYVDSVHGSDANGGQSADDPFATLATAIAAAQSGDVIHLAPNHAENITAAGGVTVNVANLTIVSDGQGAGRATFTLTGDTAATFLVTSAGLWLEGVIFTTNATDQVVSCLDLRAADITLNGCVIRDKDSTHEFVKGILTSNAGCPRLNVLNLSYEGQTAGTHNTVGILLDGNGEVTIAGLRFYGKASTSVVQFANHACPGVQVTGGNIYNASDLATYAKDVVDTITGSKWVADFYDWGVGAEVIGGSGAALGIAEAVGSAVTTLQGKLFQSGAATVAGAAKGVFDAIGFDGVARVTSTAGMLAAAAGTVFAFTKTLVSSAILQTGVDISLASSGGDIEVLEIHLNTDGTGLAAATNLQIVNNNAKGATLMAAEAVANLGASKTVQASAASVTKLGGAAGTQGVRLESGKKLTAKATVADGTGAGTIDVTVVCRRLADGATLAAA